MYGNGDPVMLETLSCWRPCHAGDPVMMVLKTLSCWRPCHDGTEDPVMMALETLS